MKPLTITTENIEDIKARQKKLCVTCNNRLRCVTECELLCITRIVNTLGPEFEIGPGDEEFDPIKHVVWEPIICNP